jgi:hypothetical protein
VVVRNFYFMRSIILPCEAHSKLIVDSDAVLAASVALKFFEAISRWDAQVVEVDGCLNLIQLAQCNRFYIVPATVLPAREEFVSVDIFEALNHPEPSITIILRIT